MAIGDIYKLSVVGTFGTGQQFVMTHHYRQELATIIDTPAEDLANEFNDDVVPELIQILPIPYIVNTIEVRQITGGLEGYDLPSEAQGIVSGEPLPPQVCPLVKWGTGLIGRRNRGRTYFPAPVESAQSAGQLETGFKANVQTVADKHIQIGGVLDTTWQLVVYGYPCPGCDPARTENITVITAAIVRQDLATQRRRRIGTGS